MNMKESSPLRCMMYGKALKHFCARSTCVGSSHWGLWKKRWSKWMDTSKIWQNRKQKRNKFIVRHGTGWNTCKFHAYMLSAQYGTQFYSSGTQKRERETYEKRGYGRGYYWGHLVQTSGREQIQNCETLVAPLVYKTFYSWSQAATVAQTEAQRPMLWKEKSSHAAVIFKYGSTELVCARWWARLAIVAGVFCSTGRATMNVSVKGPNDGKMSYR